MSGHYRSRWASSTSAGRTSPSTRRSSLSSTVEPSTYGTSWNSVRWNKPTTSGYRSHSARIRDSFETKPSYSLSTTTRASSTPKYNASNAVKVAQDVVSLGPPVSQRASRFDSSTQEKYREEARELLEKYTSRDRTGPALSSMKSGYYSRHFEPKKLGETSTRLSSGTVFTTPTPRASSAYRSSVTPTKSFDLPFNYSSTSRYSVDRTPTLSSYTPIVSTPKERPWRTRLAEAARLRATVGDEASASYTAARASRRGSLTQASGDESLTRELSTLKNTVASASRPDSTKTHCVDENKRVVQIVSSGSVPPKFIFHARPRVAYRHSSRQSSADSSYGGGISRYSTPASSILDRYPSVTRTGALFSTSTPKPYMSRSFSPVRSPVNPFQNNSTSRLNSTRSLSPSSKESLKKMSSSEKTTISTAPTTSPIQEGNEKENENRDRKTQARSSSKARAARRASRQREVEKSSSSEGEDCENRSLSRHRRRLKKKTSKDNDASAPRLPGTEDVLDSGKPEMVS
ncbi:unnamed protein product, partial [Mesorhabditis belari]|uniref:Uncharacterized protein n=1 Tax=Mesorhabditis belari TaxID=2138241 RepID=A0AAF3EU12_9BILA